MPSRNLFWWIALCVLHAQLEAFHLNHHHFAMNAFKELMLHVKDHHRVISALLVGFLLCFFPFVLSCFLIIFCLGTYSGRNSTVCTPCPAGTFSSDIMAWSCGNCAGSYSEIGSSECIPCQQLQLKLFITMPI